MKSKFSQYKLPAMPARKNISDHHDPNMQQEDLCINQKRLFPLMGLRFESFWDVSNLCCSPLQPTPSLLQPPTLQWTTAPGTGDPPVIWSGAIVKRQFNHPRMNGQLLATYKIRHPVSHTKNSTSLFSPRSFMDFRHKEPNGCAKRWGDSDAKRA